MKTGPQLGVGTSLDKNKHASIAHSVELSMTRLGEAERKGIEIKLTGQKKKKKKEENGEAHETQSWYCLDEVLQDCEAAAARQFD